MIFRQLSELGFFQNQDFCEFAIGYCFLGCFIDGPAREYIEECLLMDKDVKDANGSINNPEATLSSPKVENHVNGEYDSDSNSLLPPRRGGMSRKSDNTRRKVQWNDKNGNKLAEVLEFEPSDVSDSEDDDDSCICTIM